MKKKILFLAAHRPGRSPGQRFRFEQYLDVLRENNFQCDISWIINEKDDKYLYKKGFYFHKFFIFLKSIFIRYRDLQRAKNYDIIYIYREVVMHGSVWFEKRFKKKCKNIIFDFDDAIWLKDVSEGNKNLAWLKRPSKTGKIISLSSTVIAGNQYLAEYAKQYNDKTFVFPTTINTSLTSLYKKEFEPQIIRIGWTGSMTTLRHLNEAIPFLKLLFEKFNDRIILRVIADKKWEHPEINSEFVFWNAETELEDLNEIDIGIMPLPDDEWSRGKCGFKGLQYMALGIPTLMSPVGVNTEIIQHGENGFLCSTTEEWTECISKLIESPELRKKLGKNGRVTVEEKFSYTSQKNKYLKIFQDLLESK